MNVKSMSYTGKVLWTVWELDVEDYEILFSFFCKKISSFFILIDNAYFIHWFPRITYCEPFIIPKFNLGNFTQALDFLALGNGIQYAPIRLKTFLEDMARKSSKIKDLSLDLDHPEDLPFWVLQLWGASFLGLQDGNWYFSQANMNSQAVIWKLDNWHMNKTWVQSRIWNQWVAGVQLAVIMSPAIQYLRFGKKQVGPF